MEHIYQSLVNRKWYFTDEVGLDYGPYDTEEECHNDFIKYYKENLED